MAGHLLMRKARDLAKIPRKLECYFVEDDPTAYAMERIPALVFLDPFGLMVPFETAVMPFQVRPARPGAQPTETLINFDATLLRRIGWVCRTRYLPCQIRPIFG